MICDYCGKEIIGRSAGSHKIHCEQRPAELKQITSEKISKNSSGRKHTEESKKLISERRKEYLLKNPDKVPYKLNHKSKETYPETYFKECLPGFIYQYHIPDTLYHGDFVNPFKKLIIEIDGEQHYVDDTIVKHDIKRTEKLTSLGWNIIRIRWRDFQRLNKVEKTKIVEKLNEDKIEGFDMTTYVKPIPMCSVCGKEILKDSKLCNECSGIANRKFNPTKEELIEKYIELKNISAVGRFYGVKPPSVRKRFIKFGIDYNQL